MAKQEDLKLAFEKGLISEDALARILQYNSRLEANNIPVIYNLRHLRKILKIRKSDQDLYFGSQRNMLYRQFEIPKKAGGTRTIQAPDEHLKAIQTWIKNEILDKFSPSEYATGFRNGLSIVDNARPHVGKELVINLDIKDFFPSITYADVIKVFSYMGYKTDVAHLLTRLCTNANNVLPQGSPASPALSNLVALKLDKRLSALAKSLNSDYSRYADDITFSGAQSLRNVVPLVKRIIEDEGFTTNENKVRLQYAYQRQEVTGLIVNKKLTVSNKLLQEINSAVYYCKKFGVTSHMHYIGCDKSFYKEHLYGIAYYIKMVEPDKGNHLLEELDEITW